MLSRTVDYSLQVQDFRNNRPRGAARTREGPTEPALHPRPSVTHAQVPLSIQEVPAWRRCIAARQPEVLRGKLGQTAPHLVQNRAHKPEWTIRVSLTVGAAQG